MCVGGCVCECVWVCGGSLCVCVGRGGGKCVWGGWCGGDGGCSGKSNTGPHVCMASILPNEPHS